MPDPRRAFGFGDETEDPGQELPIAARPAVMTRRADIVSRREFLDDFDIRGEPGARERSLEQVVAQQRRVGRAARESRLEGVDIVDAFAGVGALAEHVLIDVGNRRGIGVDSAGARKNSLKQRAFAARGKRWRHPRLQDGVSLNDHSAIGVQTRPIERMRHLPYQSLNRLARQSRVRIKSDDISNVFRRPRRSVCARERGVRRASKQPVQLVKLTPFAFPPDPARFGFAPYAPAVQ